jgi:putative transposase
MKRRTAEEKEKILLDIEKIGVVEGCRKHSIAATTYYEWERKYKSYGLKGLKSYSRVTDSDVKKLEQENTRLKSIVAEKELKIKMQEELLKKKMLLWDKRKK